MAPVTQEKILPKSPVKYSKKRDQAVEIRPYIGKSQMFSPEIGSAMRNQKEELQNSGW